ncbi:MAG: hypothetical protein ACI865_003411, partial [Flavobacteriaceae bacterium]
PRKWLRKQKQLLLRRNNPVSFSFLNKLDHAFRLSLSIL